METTNTEQDVTPLTLSNMWVITETHTKSKNKKGRYVGHDYWHGIADQDFLDQFCDEQDIEPLCFDELTEEQLLDSLLPKVATGEFGRFYIRKNTEFPFKHIYKNDEDFEQFLQYHKNNQKSDLTLGWSKSTHEGHCDCSQLEAIVSPVRSLWFITVVTSIVPQEDSDEFLIQEDRYGFTNQSTLDGFCNIFGIEPLSFETLTEEQLCNALLPKVTAGEIGRFYISRNTRANFEYYFENNEDRALFIQQHKGVRCSHGVQPKLPEFLR